MCWNGEANPKLLPCKGKFKRAIVEITGRFESERALFDPNGTGRKGLYKTAS
jgi:hypothetical protein